MTGDWRLETLARAARKRQKKTGTPAGSVRKTAKQDGSSSSLQELLYTRTAAGTGHTQSTELASGCECEEPGGASCGTKNFLPF